MPPVNQMVRIGAVPRQQPWFPTNLLHCRNKFKKVLNGQARAVLTTDPFVTTDPDLRPLDEVIAASDLLILCAPHAAYRDADFKGRPVFDVWGHLQGANIIR
jgi:UDP-N-acetyl-D-mannosaminuronic acid dehydrogenase